MNNRIYFIQYICSLCLCVSPVIKLKKISSVSNRSMSMCSARLSIESIVQIDLQGVPDSAALEFLSFLS